jgi:hypothetical protein
MATDSSPSRLGRGLDSMVSEVSSIKAGSSPTGGGFMRVPVTEIRENRPGRTADVTLLDSIKKFGVLQPVLISRADHGYVLLAGSRRLHGAREAGLADVPALIIPPDRAGAIDVYLDENLARRELSETERMRLRDQWTRETGRDEEQARQRIPEIFDETNSETAPSSRSIWKIATGVLVVTCLGLAIIILNTKPADYRPVVIPVEFVDQKPQATEAKDTAWMNSFLFPGLSRAVESDRLTLKFPPDIMNGNNLTPLGQLYLNQFAAVTLSSEHPLAIDLVARTSDQANTAIAHLAGEGIPADRINVRVETTLDPSTELKIVLHP